MKKKLAQNIVEYLLIAAMVAMAGYIFASKFDFRSLKNYVFMGPADSADSTKIKIEAMTE